MPKYKNSFRIPAYHEETIVDASGDVVGMVRLKPSSILWKPRGARMFYSVGLTKFIDWITDDKIGARKTKS